MGILRYDPSRMVRHRRPAHTICGRALWLGIVDQGVAGRNGTVPDRDGADATPWRGSTRGRPSFHKNCASLTASEIRRPPTSSPCDLSAAPRKRALSSDLPLPSPPLPPEIF